MIAAAPPPQVQLKVLVQTESIEIRGTAKGPSRGHFTLYAARRCSSKKRKVSAHGPFKAGSFVAQLAFSILPVRQGRVCYRIRRGERTSVKASRRYRVPAP